jgi:hypothetical protein
MMIINFFVQVSLVNMIVWKILHCMRCQQVFIMSFSSAVFTVVTVMPFFFLFVRILGIYSFQFFFLEIGFRPAL